MTTSKITVNIIKNISHIIIQFLIVFNQNTFSAESPVRNNQHPPSPPWRPGALNKHLIMLESGNSIFNLMITYQDDLIHWGNLGVIWGLDWLQPIFKLNKNQNKANF